MAEIFSISSHASYRSKFHRTQREAGIHDAEWEDRIKPLRPWATDIRDALLCVALMCAVCALLWR